MITWDYIVNQIKKQEKENMQSNLQEQQKTKREEQRKEIKDSKEFHYLGGNMQTKESIFETFARTVCSNCKKEECQEELRLRIDKTIKCDEYIKESKLEGYKKPLKKTAKLERTVMGLSSSEWS